jgi:hypothetical protein
VTRDQQIRKALELLSPPLRERAECQHDIGLALDRVGKALPLRDLSGWPALRKARRD